MPRVPAARRVARAGRRRRSAPRSATRPTGAARCPASAIRRRGCSSPGSRPPRTAGNRTGRVFTGDRSGDWLFASMHRTGFANQPTSVSADDGLELRDAYVAAAVRCAPPANKPTPEERDRCLPYLERELALLDRVRVDRGARRLRLRSGRRACSPRAARRCRCRDRSSLTASKCRPSAFVVLGCFHPSQQNTFTGRLTEPMIDDVFLRARELAEAGTLDARDLRGRLLKGVYVPLITPFAADGSVALDAIDSSVPRVPRRRLRRASSPSAPPGSRTALEADEQRAVIDACAAACDERGAQLIVGAGTNNTAKTIAAVEALARHAGARRRADRRAVLRAPVGSRDRRALQGGRRREPGAAS